MKPRDYSSIDQRRKEKQRFAHSLGQHLRKIREKKGISQEKLSLDAGYYHTYVNKIEMGNYSPSMHTVWRLASALKMTLSEFFKEY